MPKKVLYGLIAAVSCAVITCATVLCFVFVGNGSPDVKAATIDISHDFTGANGSTNLSPLSRTLRANDTDGQYGNADITTNENFPGSPGGALRFTYPAGWYGGTAPAHCGVSFAPTDELYAQWSFKYSDNWQPHQTGDKQVYVYLYDANSGSGVSDFPVITWRGTEGEYYWVDGVRYWRNWNTANTMMMGTQQYTEPRENNPCYAPDTTVIKNNTWYTVKIYAKVNPNGRGDFKMWVKEYPSTNFTLVMDLPNQRYPNGPKYTNGQTATINRFAFEPVWGGVGGRKAQTDYFYVDALKISNEDWDNPPAPPLGAPNIMDHHFNNWGPFTPWGNAKIDPTNSAPGSPGGSARVDYNAGYGDGGSPGFFEHALNQSLDEIWMEFSFKYSDNYMFHHVANKVLYLIGEGPSYTYCNLVFNCDDNEIRLIYQGSHGGGYANIVEPTNTVKIKPGIWYTVKIHIKLNTGTSSDGVLEVWVNDTKTINRTNIPYRQGTSAGIKMQYVKFDPVLGGGDGLIKSADDYILYDAVKISTADFHNDNPQSPAAPGNIVR